MLFTSECVHQVGGGGGLILGSTKRRQAPKIFQLHPIVPLAVLYVAVALLLG